MNLSTGTILFAGPDDESGLAEARQYIARSGLGSETVRLVRTEGLVLVKTKEEMEL